MLLVRNVCGGALVCSVSPPCFVLDFGRLCFDASHVQDFTMRRRIMNAFYRHHHVCGLLKPPLRLEFPRLVVATCVRVKTQPNLATIVENLARRLQAEGAYQRRDQNGPVHFPSGSEAVETFS